MRLTDLLISPDWWVTALAAGYAHYAKIFIFPVCASIIDSWEPTVASGLFVTAITLVVAEHDLWPPSLRCPPVVLLLLYEVKFICQFVSNNAMYFHKCLL